MALPKDKRRTQSTDVDGQSLPVWPVYPADLAWIASAPQLSTEERALAACTGHAPAQPELALKLALVLWNNAVAAGDEAQFAAFLREATRLRTSWLCASEDTQQEPLMRAASLTLGLALSVFTRAYRYTHEEAFLMAARRVVTPFESDILDGGICAPLGEQGLFFEAAAVYPAAHTLSTCLCALLGLCDYLALTNDSQTRMIVQRVHSTLHTYSSEFDAGFWTYSDLLRRELTSSTELAFQLALLHAFADAEACEHCKHLARRWQQYQQRVGCRARAYFGRLRARAGRSGLRLVRRRFFSAIDTLDQLRVCVPVTAFPVLGGTRTVLAGVVEATKGIWQVEYLTRVGSPPASQETIHYFGSPRLFPSQFPNVWFYGLTGFWKLCSLLRKGPGYGLLLPQDGVFTSAFTALAGKLAGVRVVCIDHGNLTLVRSQAYRVERLQTLDAQNWSAWRRLTQRLRYACYWPSLRLLATLASHCVDHFLIPGLEGDGTEEQCQRLGIRASQITRFASVIELDNYRIPVDEERASIRRSKGIEIDAVVVSLVCRLAPEKGLDIALAGLHLALTELSEQTRRHVRVIIAGDGPLRKGLEKDLLSYGLEQNCVFWGEVSHEDIATLLGISDIFLYTSTRGACFSMSVLEAMASACAVIASTAPLSNAHLLSEGRGIAIVPGQSAETKEALLRLLKNPALCRQMGALARDYIAQYHNATLFQRILLRAAYGSSSAGLLVEEREHKW